MINFSYGKAVLFVNKTIYIASCTKDGGIYSFSMLEGGRLTQTGFTPVDCPMYMIAENGKMHVILKAPFENNESGFVTYDILPDGTLTNPTEIISTKGTEACHLCEDEGNIYCVNYVSGSVIKLSSDIVTHNGSGPNLPRQAGPHTHFVGLTPDKKYILVTDLGLDTIFIYDKNLNVVSSAKVPEGYGVRHLAFSDCGRYVFAINELISSVSVFSYKDGSLEIIDTKGILPDNFTDKSLGGAIRVHNGLIYASNRGHESIAELSFDGKSLKLLNLYSCHGVHPRDFDFVEDYIISTNMRSDNVAVMKICNGKTVLADNIEIKEPLCVLAL